MTYLVTKLVQIFTLCTKKENNFSQQGGKSFHFVFKSCFSVTTLGPVPIAPTASIQQRRGRQLERGLCPPEGAPDQPGIQFLAARCLTLIQFTTVASRSGPTNSSSHACYFCKKNIINLSERQIYVPSLGRTLISIVPSCNSFISILDPCRVF